MKEEGLRGFPVILFAIWLCPSKRLQTAPLRPPAESTVKLCRSLHQHCLAQGSSHHPAEAPSLHWPWRETGSSSQPLWDWVWKGILSSLVFVCLIKRIKTPLFMNSQLPETPYFLASTIPTKLLDYPNSLRHPLSPTP